ncbi:MAG: hypothetical protein M9936_28000 [Caldilinea sp.]|nr:hypothetical protein [Caldilineaceae bacterium]MCO5213560.1 hypothetical protein [Caldilinea sp.]
MKITTLGTSGGEGGYPFAEYAIPDGARIAAIRVLSGWYVDSIQLVYADAAGNETPMETVGGAGLHFAERENLFVLDSDEYLVGISGTSGQYVDNIRFHTNKRDSELFGGRGGDNSFSFMADAGSQVIGFFGRADWYLDAIGVLVKKMPAAEAPKKAVKKAAAKKEAAPATAAAEAPKKATKKATAKKEAAVEAPAVEAPAAEAPKKAAKKATAKKEAAVEAPAVEAPAAEAPKKAAKKATAKKDAAVEAPAVEAPAAEAPKKAAKKATAKKEAAAEPVVVEATRAAAVVEAIAVTPDDLTVIEGIGPKIAELLAADGITTFAALAATPADRLKELLLAGGRRFAIADPATWSQQAALAASGDKAGLAALQASLKGGRKAN